MQSMMSKCEDCGGDDIDAFSFDRLLTFSPVGSFPGKLESFGGSQKVETVFFFFPVRKQGRWFLTTFPTEKAHRPHLISVKHDCAEKWLTFLRWRSVEVQSHSASGGNLFFFFLQSVSRSPGRCCLFFSVGRLINHEYLMIACSGSDRAAGLMENVNVNVVHLH